jgi:hypothetical protein
MSDYIDYRVRVFKNGDQYWNLNDKFHREEGPALDFSNGDKYWYLNDKVYTEAEHKLEMAKRNNTCDGKIITIEGKEYTLTEVKK